MKCTKCNQELRVESQKISENATTISFQKTGYCDTCMFKFNLGYYEMNKPNVSFQNSNTNNNIFNPVSIEQPKTKKKDSTGSIIAAFLSLFIYTYIIGFIIAIMDLLLNDKTKRHLGSWFAIIMSIILFVFGIGFDDDKENDNKYYLNTDQKTTEGFNETSTQDKAIQIGQVINYDGLSIEINECDLNYTKDMPKLDDGTKYIYLSFTITNNAENDTFVSIYDFECYADNTYCEPNFHIEHKLTSATLSKDRSVLLCVSYYVPIDSEEIELEFESNIWTDEKLILKLK